MSETLSCRICRMFDVPTRCTLRSSSALHQTSEVRKDSDFHGISFTGQERLHCNSNTVNSKFHLIRSYCEIFFCHFPNISCLKCTVNSNFHLIRSKTLPMNDFELTVPNLYFFYFLLKILAPYLCSHFISIVFTITQWSQ